MKIGSAGTESSGMYLIVVKTVNSRLICERLDRAQNDPLKGARA